MNKSQLPFYLIVAYSVLRKKNGEKNENGTRRKEKLSQKRGPRVLHPHLKLERGEKACLN
jgi:hypothetical protein